MRSRVWSLALLSGLSIRCGHELWYVTDMAWIPCGLWLWCRPATTAPIQPPAWAFPCAAGAALKKKIRKKPFYYSWFTTFCQFLLYSKVTQLHIYIHSLSHILFHHIPSQVTRHSSLCCTAGFHCLSTPNAIICIYQPVTPSPSHYLPAPPWQSLFSMSLFLFCRWVHLCHILDSRYKWYMVFVFLWMSSLSIKISSSIHVAAMALFCSFFL